MAHLEVIALDQDGAVLEDVFITFSAGKNVLKGQTDSDGQLNFSDLASPQKYYLTALKKEYQFPQNQQVIEVKEEEHKRIELRGEKTLFSCYGLITTLQGQPITSGVAIATFAEKIEQGVI